MNALQSNDYTRAWEAIGNSIPRPKAILSISAHWYIGRTAVTAMQTPRTIHDFGGFPQDLYEVDYHAPGDPDLAERARELLSPYIAELDYLWGLYRSWNLVSTLSRIPQSRYSCSAA